MTNEYCGDMQPGDARFAIVVSKYNDSITGKLLTGAIDTLRAHHVADDSIDVAWVPGAWEIPLVADRMAKTNRYAAIICLGAVIRGETTHDQHINRHVSICLGKTSLDCDLPVLMGVLTCNSLEQAINRSGGAVGNKGVECAEAALEMVSLLRRLPTNE